MATNPPIVIGPFDNVPAPGSGVKSDWPQQITNYVLRTPWTAVTFAGAWVNFGAPYQVCQYRKNGDIVEVRGLIKSGTINTPAFTLPVGFRPPADIGFPAASNSLFGAILISAAGSFIPNIGNNASFWANCAFSVAP